MTMSVCGFVCPLRAHSYKSRLKYSRLLVTLQHSRFSRPWKWNDGGRPPRQRVIPPDACGRARHQRSHVRLHGRVPVQTDSQTCSPLSLLKTEYLLTFPSQSFSFMGRILESLQWKKLNETCDLYLLKKTTRLQCESVSHSPKQVFTGTFVTQERWCGADGFQRLTGPREHCPPRSGCLRSVSPSVSWPRLSPGVCTHS